MGVCRPTLRIATSTRTLGQVCGECTLCCSASAHQVRGYKLWSTAQLKAGGLRDQQSPDILCECPLLRSNVLRVPIQRVLLLQTDILQLRSPTRAVLCVNEYSEVPH